jgi:hypothetical protein
MKIGFIIAVLTASIAGAGTGAAPVRRLPPADEAATCPGFVEFRASLRQIIERKDSAGLLDVVDPNVRISFGDDNGRDAFRTRWLTEAAPGPDVWTALSRVLDLGGRCKAADSFVAPYVFTDWPGDLDAFEYAAITGSRVRLRQAPRETAPVVALLTYALVRAGGAGDPQSGWAPVEAPDGRKGFVARRFLRSSVDVRAFFSRRDGVWRLVTLVTGD